ncbi:MAG: hypothetical protein ABI432_02500 [Flavobacteriales bacterium]
MERFRGSPFILCALWCLVIPASSHAQQSQSWGLSTWSTDLKVLANGDLFLSGSHSAEAPFTVMRLTNQLEVVWARSLGMFADFNTLETGVETSDGRLVLVGSSYSDSSGHRLALMALAADGSFLWGHKFIGIPNGTPSLVAMDDGSVVLFSAPASTSGQRALMRLNGNGGLVWSKSISGGFPDHMGLDQSGDLLFCGHDGLLARANADGEVLWSFFHQTASYSLASFDVCTLATGHLMHAIGMHYPGGDDKLLLVRHTASGMLSGWSVIDPPGSDGQDIDEITIRTIGSGTLAILFKTASFRKLILKNTIGAVDWCSQPADLLSLNFGAGIAVVDSTSMWIVGATGPGGELHHIFLDTTPSVCWTPFTVQMGGAFLTQQPGSMSTAPLSVTALDWQPVVVDAGVSLSPLCSPTDIRPQPQPTREQAFYDASCHCLRFAGDHASNGLVEITVDDLLGRRIIQGALTDGTVMLPNSITARTVVLVEARSPSGMQVFRILLNP